jgi:hypothetical protein
LNIEIYPTDALDAKKRKTMRRKSICRDAALYTKQVMRFDSYYPAKLLKLDNHQVQKYSHKA